MKVPKPRKLKSGTWFIQLRLGGESIPITAKTEKECIKQAEFIKSEYRIGKREKQEPEPEKEEALEKLPTLGEAIDSYINNRDAVLSPSTVNGYDSIKRNRFQELMDVSLSDISAEEWQAACNDESKKVAAKTVDNAWGLVSAVMRKNGLEPPEITLPTIIPNERPWLNSEEVLAFIKAIKGKSVEIPALLALHSLRRSEILALKWENIDFKRRIIHVRGAAVLDRHNKLVQKPENKNTTSTRDVPIMINELYDVLMEKRQTSGLIVKCCPTSIWANVNRICEKEHFPLVGVHGLRHSFASVAYHLKVPAKITKTIGGWADDQTMNKIYTHIEKADIEKSVDDFKNYFLQTEQKGDKNDENANKNAN